MRKLQERWRKFLCDERGNVESAMVLIPLLILFLAGMQVSIAIHTRNIVRMDVQDVANTRAISGDFLTSDVVLPISSSSSPLNLLVVRRERNIPATILNSPIVVGGRRVDVQGFAVVEGTG